MAMKTCQRGHDHDAPRRNQTIVGQGLYYENITAAVSGQPDHQQNIRKKGK